MRGFLRICHEHLRESMSLSHYMYRSIAHLEHMESLKLNVLALVPEEVHHHFEVGLVGDVPRHYIEVCSIKEDLAQQLERLSFRNVVI